MKYILIACVCGLVACFLILLITAATYLVYGTDLMDAIVERIMGKSKDGEL